MMSTNPEEVKAAFAPLRVRVSEIGQQQGQDRHPGMIGADDPHWRIVPDPDLALFSELARLADEGLSKVQSCNAFFRENALYADDNFWYQQFLLIGAAAQGRIASTTQAPIPPQVVLHLYGSLLSILDYSSFTGNAADIAKRNFEALALLFQAFPYQALLDRLEDAQEHAPHDEASGVLERCLQLAREETQPEPIGSRIYGLSTLKDQRPEEPSGNGRRTVQCPVSGCTWKAPRATRSDTLESPAFRCPFHGIYISPSTFIYEREQDNLLWVDEESRTLLDQVMKGKRESRMAHERSEDAVTWNVFRFFDMNGLLGALVTHWTGWPASDATIAYWSTLAAPEGRLHPLLASARQAFDERPPNLSEPDLILETADSLLYVEAKLTSANRMGRPVDEAKVERYAQGAGGWAGKALKTSCADMAVAADLYQLMRLWLLGSWAAAQVGKKFALINLVPERAESDIEEAVKRHVATDDRRLFRRQSWEGIYRWVSQGDPQTEEAPHLLSYLEEKTVGYSGSRILRAFDL